ncbi:Histone H3 (Lys9) methyltransferase SUV39H1/Clr4, required for transcriptional silencing [Ceraceosorus bombacis]|uniref:Histone H3 (Lys9) methyltransferase SUV39H1/Clr4, required for transcriptional silencing n=1 Tax=Ceraceosorus bombacis TaxID=401625 RepID=A0A0P1BRB9_9BASI|nr:Histone H3 (Lys9) methyltransferase SUV39H1/Clr4, required for transcriptional silencing [Ceraceosorus bombacis]
MRRSSPHPDISSSRERLPIPYCPDKEETCPSAKEAVEKCLLGSLQSYIPESIVHETWRKEALAHLLDGDRGAALARTGSSQASEIEERLPEDDGHVSDPYEGSGCSCIAKPGGSCCTADTDCECVESFGNFYSAANDQLNGLARIVHLDALPARHALRECTPLCACQQASPSIRSKCISTQDAASTEDEAISSRRPEAVDRAKRRKLKSLEVGRESKSYEDARQSKRASMQCANRVVGFGLARRLYIRSTAPRLGISPHRCSKSEGDAAISADLNSACRGLGLFTHDFIPRGAFVIEYAGEVISTQEARKRWVKYQKPSMYSSEKGSDPASSIAISQSDTGPRPSVSNEGSNYILVLQEWMNAGTHTGHTGFPSTPDPLSGTQATSALAPKAYRTNIDPTISGNAGRFANHSCEPNLIMIPVRCDEPIKLYDDTSASSTCETYAAAAAPRAALFAARDIQPDDELTFDYSGGELARLDGSQRHGEGLKRNVGRSGATPCLCGAPSCRGWMYFDPAL